MIIKKRSSVFETNSSSIHSLCIPNNMAYQIPDYVDYRLEQYGWGPDIVDDTGSYLYTALMKLGDIDHICQLKDVLYRHGVKDVQLERADRHNWLEFWVDHVEDLKPFIEEIFADEEKLLRFLFTPGAVVYITNDNDPDSKILRKMGKAKERGEEVFYK